MIIPFACKKVKITSPYTVRTLAGKTAMHTGYDLVGVGSTAVTAAADGTVVQSRIVTDKNNLTWEWGNYVCIRTDGGQYHYYCHLASRTVQAGERVKVGDRIGIMGNTGYSFGAHLHFEVRASDGRTTLSPESVLGLPNAVGTYSLPESKSDYIRAIAEKVGYDEPTSVIAALEAVKHPFAADLFRKLYEHLA